MCSFLLRQEPEATLLQRCSSNTTSFPESLALYCIVVLYSKEKPTGTGFGVSSCMLFFDPCVHWFMLFFKSHFLRNLGKGWKWCLQICFIFRYFDHFGEKMSLKKNFFFFFVPEILSSEIWAIRGKKLHFDTNCYFRIKIKPLE